MALSSLMMPLVRMLEPETAHDLALWSLEKGLAGEAFPPQSDRLKTQVFGLDFQNPIGLAAGFDKDARALKALFRLGFGFVEVGTVTPKPQPGNPKPRLFRLTADQAVINRFGFNNQGHDAMARRVDGQTFPGPLGINLGKNKTSEDEVEDYVLGVKRFAKRADYLTVNVSSPNTPGLRTLQDKGPLLTLLTAVMAARDEVGETATPVLLKIAPDLEDADIEDIAEVALSSGIDGLIATNTTISRPDYLRSADRGETGGLSGKPVFAMSTEVLRKLYRATGGKLPLIGVGGVATGDQAYAKIKAGASLVQLYSALVYEGPALAAKIASELDDLLTRDGVPSVKNAVGVET